MTPTQTLLKREYGQAVYDLAQRLLSFDDAAERTRQAQLVVNLMVKVHPTARELPDPQPRLWHHLLMLCAGHLDVEVPYELPPVGPDDLTSLPPEKMVFRLRIPKQRHYGRNIETLVQHATRLTDPEDRIAAIVTIGRLMKAFYRTYNKDAVTDATILKHLGELSENRLNDIPLERIQQERLFDSQLVVGNGPGQPLNDATRTKFNKKGGGGGGGMGGKKRKR